MKKVLLVVMTVVAISFIGCKNNNNSSTDIIGMWVCDSEGEYEGIPDDFIRETLNIKQDGTLTEEISAYGEEFISKMMWYTEGNKIYMIYTEDDKMPEGIRDTVCCNYELTDNTLKLSQGMSVSTYNRIK